MYISSNPFSRTNVDVHNLKSYQSYQSQNSPANTTTIV